MERKGNYFAYMRISTKEEREMQRFNRQEKSINWYAKEQGFDYTLVFHEDKSGKDFNRPEFKRMISILQPGDTVVFKDISRFSRSADGGYEMYMELFNKGIHLVFLDNQTISTDYIDSLLQVAKNQDLIARVSLEHTVRLLLLVELDRCQKERETIVKRTKDGIAASNKKSGRPVGKLDKMTPELREDIKLYLLYDQQYTQAEFMEKHRISRNTLKKYIRLVGEEVNGSK